MRRCQIYARSESRPSTVINEIDRRRITCECRMGELVGGFHPGGISAPLPASADGHRVVVTNSSPPKRIFLGSLTSRKRPSSRQPGSSSVRPKAFFPGGRFQSLRRVPFRFPNAHFLPRRDFSSHPGGPARFPAPEGASPSPSLWFGAVFNSRRC